MTVTPGSGGTPLDLYEAAVKWHESGCSVIPIATNGTKRPLELWKRNQSEQIHPNEWGGNKLDFWRRPPGIGLVCGKVSGNLELTEIEARACDAGSLTAIRESCADYEVDGIWDSLNRELSVMSPSGGLHLIYRVSDHEVPGNTKIARRPATADELAEKPDDKIKVLAETRGEGGYFIAAPTGGTVHPSGSDWRIVAGEIGVIPTITWAERNALHEAIHAALDEMPEPQTPSHPPVPQHHAPIGSPSANRPGDDYNERADWITLLTANGWQWSHSRGGTRYWTRPGKDPRDGHSATTGHAGQGALDRLYVMSSATDLPTDEPLSKFYVYAHYNHNGNFAEATKALAAQGYGEPSYVDTRKAEARRSDSEWDGAWVDAPDSTENVPRTFGVLPRPRGIRDYTTSGACVRFTDQWGDCIRYVHEEKKWRVWDGVSWIVDKGGAQVISAFEVMTETMYAEAASLDDEDPKKKPYQAHVRKLRDLGKATILAFVAPKVTITADAFDADPRYLNLQNGIYDTRDLVLLPHHPKYLLTKVMGAAYDPQAKAPETEKFFADLMPDADIRDYVTRALGYTLTGEADQRAFFLLHGLPGTGKTQFIEMMQALFGDYGVTAMPSTFHKRPNTGGPTPDLHALRGARFITTSETSQDSQLDEELLKRFTGRDTMSTRSLFEEPQEWIPQGTVWVATNHLPKFSSDESAIWRRVKTVGFPTQFSDDGSIGQRGEPNIGRKLAAKEADGILALLLEALARYRADGYLAEPPQLKQQVADHKRDVDPVAQFWDEMTGTEQIAPDQDGAIEFKALYATYCEWYKENMGQYPMGRRRFGDGLRSTVGYTDLRKTHGKVYLDGWTKRGWIIGGRE